LRPRPCEPAGFDDTARSLRSGQAERNSDGAVSICDAILTPAPGQLTLPILRAHCGPGLVATDDEALQAMALAFAHLRIVLEPGGAIALACALFRTDLPDTVICTASGGNVDPALFVRALERFAA
jgi:threonine dehydratase